MFELMKSLIDQNEKELEEMIKQLIVLKSTQRYQLQCLMLDHITEKTYELNTKAKKFWDYVKTNKESWKSHYENERALKEAFSALLDIISSIKKIRNTYDETLWKIDMLWDSTKEIFARDQFVQILRSMRRCVLRDMTMKNARRVVNFAMKNRLKNFARDVSINRKSINRDWIKMTNEITICVK